MYTELIKIIEGGLSADKEKVANYALVLSDKFEKEGETKLANRIQNLLIKKRGAFTTLDSFSTKPVDIESRSEMVEIDYPKIDKEKIILNKYAESEIVKFIDSYNNRDEFIKAGVELSNSLLLYGPPGCGKTTIAKYIASITELPLITVRLDGLISSLLGSTAKNIRKIFDYASKRDCILFLDEFDVIAKLRDDKNELGELKRVVNSLIQNIDDLNSNSIFIAATNHHELLDPALWRRFSKIINLKQPQKEDITKLIKILLKDFDNSILSNEKKINQLELAFLGFSHAEIKTIIFNTIRTSIIKKNGKINSGDIFQEIYFYKHHNIENEDLFIKFLLEHDITHKEINENFGISFRKIQAISKN